MTQQEKIFKNTPGVSTHWQPSCALRAWQVLASCNPKEIRVSQKNIPLQRGFGLSYFYLVYFYFYFLVNNRTLLSTKEKENLLIIILVFLLSLSWWAILQLLFLFGHVTQWCFDFWEFFLAVFPPPEFNRNFQPKKSLPFCKIWQLFLGKKITIKTCNILTQVLILGSFLHFEFIIFFLGRFFHEISTWKMWF